MARNRTSLLKKVAVLVAVTGVSSLITLPALAQLNPRPSIFNEPTYNRSYRPRPGHEPRHGPRPRLGHGRGPRLDPRLGQQPGYGRPPAPPAYGRPPRPPAPLGYGRPPRPPAGTPLR